MSLPATQDPEVVLGLVAPVGTNLDRMQSRLDGCLSLYGYQMNVVRISELIRKLVVSRGPTDAPSSSPETSRINRSMDAGNDFRFGSRREDILALAAAQAIREQRPEAPRDGSSHLSGRLARLKTAHVIRQLKHPEEVVTLRNIYGTGFYLIGVTQDEALRRAYLKNDFACTDEEIDDLVGRDEHEDDPRYIVDGVNFGQRTRDTFHLADVFVPLDESGPLERFLDLLFGYPFHTPLPDEYAMFLAFAAAVRSADLSRQVGAVVMNEDGDVLAVGTNDVPKAGGGLYWPGADDQRDWVRGFDSNEAHRREIVDDTLRRLCPDGEDLDAWVRRGLSRLQGSRLDDLTEFGRAAHAEMEALLSCARNGISPRGCTLYSTTFPCHNCAKHIIAAGIRRVVYVEPYPKSQARDLFSDSLSLRSGDPGRVSFEQFVGVGARRYLDLFSMTPASGVKVRRKEAGRRRTWTASKGVVRAPMVPNSYLEQEMLAETLLLANTVASPKGASVDAEAHPQHFDTRDEGPVGESGEGRR